jgi:hypothetical protein
LGYNVCAMNCSPGLYLGWHVYCDRTTSVSVSIYLIHIYVIPVNSDEVKWIDLVFQLAAFSCVQFKSVTLCKVKPWQLSSYNPCMPTFIPIWYMFIYIYILWQHQTQTKEIPCTDQRKLVIMK